MKRFLAIWFLVALAVCLAPVTASAQLKVISDFEGQQGFTLYRMTVTPAAEPVPALKHRFVVPLHERKPGNAAVYYLRSLGESSGPSPVWQRLSELYGDQIYDWYEIDFPINQIPMKEFRELADRFSFGIDSYIRHASYCRECDWGLEEMDLRGPETIAFLLPDAQESRGFSRQLALLTRLATIERRYEDALEYIRMNYQLGQDFGKQRFLVCNLIGLAEVGMANKSVIELISAPNSPNLFWALSELPRPVISTRETMNLEMSLGLRIFPALLNIEDKEHSPREWTRLVETMINDLDASLELLGDTRLPRNKVFTNLGVTGLSLFVYPAAKQRLIEGGKTAEEVEAMSVAQVLLTDTAREFRKVADEYEKWTFVPYRQMREVKLPPRTMQNGFGVLLADLLLPAVTAVRTAQMRTQWQMDAIRVVEALRMHVAETGSLPRSLDEVTVVPVPRNPLTEEPYEFRLDGETAVLDLPFSDGMPGAAWRFELTLAR